MSNPDSEGLLFWETRGITFYKGCRNLLDAMSSDEEPGTELAIVQTPHALAAPVTPQTLLTYYTCITVYCGSATLCIMYNTIHNT